MRSAGGLALDGPVSGHPAHRPDAAGLVSPSREMGAQGFGDALVSAVRSRVRQR